MNPPRCKIASLLLVSLCGLVLFFEMGCPDTVVMQIDQARADGINRDVTGNDHRVQPGRYERHPNGEGDIGVHHIDTRTAGGYDLVNEQGFPRGGAYVGSDGGPGFLPATRTGDVVASNNPRGDPRSVLQSNRTGGDPGTTSACSGGGTCK